MAYIAISKNRELEMGKRKREVGGPGIMCFCRAVRRKDIKEDAVLEPMSVCVGREGLRPSPGGPGCSDRLWQESRAERGWLCHM